jgi:hypothetical protein
VLAPSEISIRVVSDWLVSVVLAVQNLLLWVDRYLHVLRVHLVDRSWSGLDWWFASGCKPGIHLDLRNSLEFAWGTFLGWSYLQEAFSASFWERRGTTGRAGQARGKFNKGFGGE